MKTFNYTFFRCKSNVPYRFRDYHEGIFNLERDYEIADTGSIQVADSKEPNQCCDMLFVRYNRWTGRENEFKGPSMSTSDVVEIDGQFFYCNGIGWVEVCKNRSDYVFDVSLGHVVVGTITVNANDIEEATETAYETVGQRLYNAFPEWDIEYNVELSED